MAKSTNKDLTTSRRLAAIMFTDIVGYTALMGSDEDKALEILRKNRQIHRESIDLFHGTLIKEMGDGMLAQFESSADAVSCAIQIQEKSRETLVVKIRIGIHLGDITFEGGDVFGDGVNIASRLQAVADPGGIYISETLQKSIRAKSHFQTKDLGEVPLKNVSHPLKIFAIQREGLPVADQAALRERTDNQKAKNILRSPALWISLVAIITIAGLAFYENPPKTNTEISSLMVLPFDNFTGTDTLEYFVSGMHSSLIGDIGKIGALTVKSKTTSRAYKGTQKSIPEIGSELNIDAVVEGSVMCLGDSICLQVKLMSTGEDERQLWIQEYKESKEQVLNLYNQITKEISEQINVILTPQEETLLSEATAVKKEAYDAYLKGLYHWEHLSAANLDQAYRYFKIAMEHEPNWGPPYASIASVWMGRTQMGFATPATAIPEIYKHINKALELDPNSAFTHAISAGLAAWTEWDWEKAEKEFLKTIELNPNGAVNRVYYSHLLTMLQRHDEALKNAEIAVDLDPLDPLVLSLACVVFVDAGEFQQGLELNKKALALDPTHFFANRTYDQTAYFSGKYKESIETLYRLYQIPKHSNYDTLSENNKQWYDRELTIILDSLESFVSLGRMPPYKYANYKLRVGHIDEALDWLEKGFELHDPNMPYIRTRYVYSEEIKDNPRYIALLEKLNLPMPEK